MKKIIATPILVLVLLTGLNSCKKNTGYTAPASFNLINAMVGTDRIVTEFGIDRSLLYIIQSKFSVYGDHNMYGQMSLTDGNHSLTAYSYPDTLSKDAALASLSFDVRSTEMVNLFFVGDKTHPDTLLVREEFPVHKYGDSTFSIRFLNLSPGSNPVRVEVDGMAQPVVSNLAYKARGGWNTFSARSDAGTYVVRFKDQVSGNEIASYIIADAGSSSDFAPNIWRKNNVTIALIGSTAISSGKYAPACFLIRHFFPG